MEVVQKIELPLTGHKTVKYTLYLCRSEEGSTETPSFPCSEEQEQKQEPMQDQETDALPTMQGLKQRRIKLQHIKVLNECRNGTREYERNPTVTLYNQVLGSARFRKT